MPAAPPSEDEDDALAEALADRLVELARQPGLLRLAARQMAGLLPETGLDDDALARELGCTAKTIYRTRRDALAKIALSAHAATLRTHLR